MQLISELEGYRRGPYAGAVGYSLPGRRDRHVHRDPDDRARATASRTCRPARGSSPTRMPAAEHEECLSKLAALETAIELAEASLVILLVDNYDSFTYNLAHLFGELGAEVVVRRNDEIDADEAERLAPTHLVDLARARAGPGTPARRSRSSAGSRPRVPTLGVCLGHQAIVEAFGGEVGPAQGSSTARPTIVRHDGQGLFRGLPRRRSRRAATTRSRRRRVPGRARGLRDGRRRRGDGRPPPRAAASTASSSIRSRC